MRYAMELGCVVVGAYFGSKLDVVSRVDGLSMYPRLEPNDRLFHIPWRLHPSSWRWRSLGGTESGRRPEEAEAGSADQHIATPWSYLLGRVVLVQVGDTMTVCKRVIGITDDPSVKKGWDRPEFATGSPELRPTNHHGTEKPQQVVAGETQNCDDAVAADEDEINDDQRAAAEAAGLESIACRRSAEWDWCLQKETPGTAAWVWVEGDNSANSFDSRHVGALPLDCVRSIVLAKIWPSLSRF